LLDVPAPRTLHGIDAEGCEFRQSYRQLNMRIAFANHFGPSPMRFGLLHGFIFASAVAAAFQAAAGQPCKLADLGTARAAAVRDGRTLTLADGRVLRLKGIEVSTGADAALKDLVAGKPLRLKKIGEARDRYGRV
jgi:hypothetical protein